MLKDMSTRYIGIFGHSVLRVPLSFLANNHIHRSLATPLLIVKQYWSNTICIYANAFAGFVLGREARVHLRQMDRRENWSPPAPPMSGAPRLEVTGFVSIINIPEYILFLTASSPVMETPTCYGVSPTCYYLCSQRKNTGCNDGEWWMSTTE